MSKLRVLLTGATGFVGSHVHPFLLERNYDVIGGTRQPDKARAHAPDKAFCHIDLEDAASVYRAFEGIDRVVYLVHSMTENKKYEGIEKKNAETVRAAAERKGVGRIVYLGGMRPAGKVSNHLMSRLETGRILRGGAVQVVELRATMIIGGGSESFRIVRDLSKRLPWMLLPKWLKSVSEPVAIKDIVAAIERALVMPVSGSKVFDAPGPSVLSGKEILMRTARGLGQQPRAIDVPLVTLALSSHWIHLVTRANAHVAKELVEGLRSDILAEGDTIWGEMPEYERTPFDTAVARALREEEEKLPTTTKLLERVLHRIAANH